MASLPPPNPVSPFPPGPGQPSPSVRSSRAARWVTGTAGKAFLIMMLALLPLAVATIIINWHSIRTSEQEKMELLEAATRQNATQLASDINAINRAQTLTANVLANDPNPGHICDRVQSLFQAMTGGEGIVMAIFDPTGAIRCSSAGADTRKMREALVRTAAIDSTVMVTPELNGLLIRSSSNNSGTTALALYRRPALQQLTNARANDTEAPVILRQDGRELVLTRSGKTAYDPGNSLTAEARVGTYNLILSMSVTGSFSVGSWVAPLVMPLVLWVAAAFLGWLVVRWILIQPLVTLRREVSAYVPGQVIHPPRISRLASSEIVELGESFRAMSQDVAEHEEEMQAALNRQTRLTREVHHRVKNNLQIISSLISLHWRASSDPKEGHAYLSIQRRVDALAVVQRNHYAELDEQRGVRARPIMNEIASNLKISAQVQSGRDIDIAVDCDDVSLHQDVAAPIAFMTAELADLVIELDRGGRFAISLIRMEEDATRARFSLAAALFRKAQVQDDGTVALYERVLTGLARQLRTPLGHDPENGEYHVIVPVTG